MILYDIMLNYGAKAIVPKAYPYYALSQKELFRLVSLEYTNTSAGI
jgi:hypothetical protein